jgi:hypothetical protein
MMSPFRPGAAINARVTSLSGRQWIVVLALSRLAPAVVAVDKAIQLRHQSKAVPAISGNA